MRRLGSAKARTIEALSRRRVNRGWLTSREPSSFAGGTRVVREALAVWVRGRCERSEEPTTNLAVRKRFADKCHKVADSAMAVGGGGARTLSRGASLLLFIVCMLVPSSCSKNVTLRSCGALKTREPQPFRLSKLKVQWDSWEVICTCVCVCQRQRQRARS